MKEWQVVVVLIIAVLILTGAALWFTAYYEAKAYNRITGSKVTTWEAVFVELRVIGEAKPCPCETKEKP